MRALLCYLSWDILDTTPISQLCIQFRKRKQQHSVGEGHGGIADFHYPRHFF